jgi:hypothetical protein
VRVAFGAKAHSGWAALVVLGRSDGGELVVVDRRRIDLVEEERGKAPYHAAEGLERKSAHELVERAIAGAHRSAAREIRAAVERERRRKHAVAACAVLVTDPMPGWSVDEILAVHFRMHKAEGVLFREALVGAAEECGLALVPITEKRLTEHAEKALGISASDLGAEIGRLGKSVGAPWGKDQKDAALAALVALEGRAR